MLRVMPDAEIGHIGLYRDEVTLRPVNYYCRLPPALAESQVVLLDPMLATGRSATEAATLLKAQGATDIQFICVVACEVGIEHLRNAHLNIPIYCAAIDPELNEFGYIVPGLGDAGDRYFGTLYTAFHLSRIAGRSCETPLNRIAPLDEASPNCAGRRARPLPRPMSGGNSRRFSINYSASVTLSTIRSPPCLR